jgi:hypothetical protein
MTKSTLTRRALVVRTAAIPAAAALALPAVAAQAATEPDPIFALIEAHRESLIRQLRTAREGFDIPYSDPAREAADEVDAQTWKIRQAAGMTLIGTRPTTFAGIVALLAYADDLHIGTVALPEAPSDWYINAEQLGSWDDEHIVDNNNGEPIELPFAFWIMRNVRAAIEQMASVS